MQGRSRTSQQFWRSGNIPRRVIAAESTFSTKHQLFYGCSTRDCPKIAEQSFCWAWTGCFWLVQTPFLLTHKSFFGNFNFAVSWTVSVHVGIQNQVWKELMHLLDCLIYLNLGLHFIKRPVSIWAGFYLKCNTKLKLVKKKIRMCFLHSFLLSCDIHKYSAKNIWERLDIDPTLRVYQPGHNFTEKETVRTGDVE